jgi:outer membrane lipoprotein SlyB
LIDFHERKALMNKTKSSIFGYLIAASLGAVAGGITVAAITRAIPKMMANMMENMMRRMGSEGCNPEEM